jgi:hypothetical protein
MGKKVVVVVVVVVVVIVTAVVVEILTFTSPVHASFSVSTLEMRISYFVIWLRKLLVLYETGRFITVVTGALLWILF